MKPMTPELAEAIGRTTAAAYAVLLKAARTEELDWDEQVVAAATILRSLAARYAAEHKVARSLAEARVVLLMGLVFSLPDGLVQVLEVEEPADEMTVLPVKSRQH